MHFGAHQDLELLALLIALGALLALSPTLRLPLPILLVLGGVVLGFVPGLPHVLLPPDVVLVAVLPPLLYSGAFFTSLLGLEPFRLAARHVPRRRLLHARLRQRGRLFGPKCVNGDL